MAQHNHGECPFVGCETTTAFSWNNDGAGNCKVCHGVYPSKGLKRRTGPYSLADYLSLHQRILEGVTTK